VDILCTLDKRCRQVVDVIVRGEVDFAYDVVPEFRADRTDCQLGIRQVDALVFL
jgi:hypothetical protein